MSNGAEKKQLTLSEKQKLLKEILGANYSSVGNNFAAFSAVMDYHGKAHDAIALVELIPSTSTLLSGSVFGGVVSASSVIGTFLFPVVQFINLVNANQTGHLLYNYRCIAYTVTAWAFSHPIPKKSQRILDNMTAGAIVRSQSVIREHDALWLKTSGKVLQGIKSECIKKKVPESHARVIFKALCGSTPDVFCQNVLQSFEEKLSYPQRLVWKSNYSIRYPS